MRRAAKVDANQAQIVDALRSCGATVQPLHTVGGGVPDLLVGYRNRTALLEVKDGSLPPSKRQLTEDQRAWHRQWRGGTLAIVCDVESAVRALNTLGAEP